MSEAVRIAVLGEFDAASPTLPKVNSSLQHAAERLGIPAHGEWISTSELVRADAQKRLETYDGIWAAPGSPYKSFQGMLNGIEFARRRNWPFFGTCGGFQYALIECARNVLGIKDADTAENNSGSKNIVIYPVACAVPTKENVARLSGRVPEIRLRPGSYLQSFYMQETVTEEFYCNYEVNPEYEWAAMEAGFPVVARGVNGEVRAIESPTHLFFVATLFQPQLSSKEGKPHPVIIAFLQAAADWKHKRLEDHILA